MTVTELVKLTPPASLLIEEPAPPCHIKTNADLAAYVLALKNALKKANVKIKAVRDWAAGQE